MDVSFIDFFLAVWAAITAFLFGLPINFGGSSYGLGYIIVGALILSLVFRVIIGGLWDSLFKTGGGSDGD